MAIFFDCWATAPLRLELAKGEVHLWRGYLTQPLECVKELETCLAPDEFDRANRFHFERDRLHFITARAMLRDILSRYLDLDPRNLHFSYTRYGKPELSGVGQESGVRFNASHSGEVALFALTLDRDIGVDVEWIRPGVVEEHIPERFFSPREVGELRSLPKRLQKEAFFNCWTRKEAFIKAVGEGLSMPLNSFDVSLRPGEPAMLLGINGRAEGASQWSLSELKIAPGYAAAIAVRAVCPDRKFWEWTAMATRP